MAIKLVIGKAAPATFPMNVEVPTPAGTAEINFVAKHLTSTAWAALREAHQEDLEKKVKALFDEARAAAEAEYAAQQKKVKKAAKGAPELTAEEVEAQREAGVLALLKPIKGSVLEGVKSQGAAALMLKITDSWDLDDTLTVNALTDMCDRYPGSAEAVFKAYNETREGVHAKN